MSTTKVNTDAAMFSNGSSFVTSRVAGDEKGSFIAAGVKIFSGVPNPEMAEAVGVREALSWMKFFRMGAAMVESDSLIIVKAIHSNVVDLMHIT